MSEPGSVPDGESLQNNDVASLKRRSWDTDVAGGYPRKRFDVIFGSSVSRWIMRWLNKIKSTAVCLSRLVKSESSDSLCSQSSGSSGTHPAIRCLRQQANRSQSASTSSATRRPSGRSQSEALEETRDQTVSFFFYHFGCFMLKCPILLGRFDESARSWEA